MHIFHYVPLLCPLSTKREVNVVNNVPHSSYGTGGKTLYFHGHYDVVPAANVAKFPPYVKEGIPAFAYGPGLLSVSHGPKEFVKIKDIYNWATIYALTAIRLLGS